MNGFLFDENLPANLRFIPALPVIHVSVLGESPSGTQIWQYAKQSDLAIVTKDAVSPIVLWSLLLRRRLSIYVLEIYVSTFVFQAFLASVWARIEALIVDYTS